MKANYSWWKLIGFIGCLLPAFAGNAQSSLCRSSFSCTGASQSNVVINPVSPGAWSQLYNTGGFTWEAWFRLKAPVINGGIIVSVEDAVPFQDIFLGFGWGSIPNALSFHVTDNGANNTVITAESLQTYTLNTWYHVAGVCDYTNASLKLYLNGALVATQALPANLLANRLYQEHSAFIGNASANASGSDIDIDEVRFWNTARTTTEIQNNRTQCLTLPQAGLVALFKADEAGAPIARSAVGANFTATLQNAGYGPPAPVADCYTIGISDNPTACKTIDFTGTVSSSITILDWYWDFGDGNTANTQNTTHIYSNFGSRHVTLTLKDNAGCGATVATDVVITPSYVNDAKAVSICQGENFMGHTTSDVFTVTAPSPDGCDTIRTYTLTVFPQFNTIIDTSLCSGGSIEGHAQPGSYTDVFRSANGCDSIRILHISACDIFFPNAFTPNGDGKNNLFKALNAVNLKDFHMVIYNRWGQLVFETRDPNQGWDGFVNGKAGAAGSYIWYCEYSKRGSTPSGKLKGSILLIR